MKLNLPSLIAAVSLISWGKAAAFSDAFETAVAWNYPSIPGYSGHSNASATAQPGEPSHRLNQNAGPFHSQWWKFTTAENGFVTLDTAGSTYDTVMAVYTGTAVNKLKRVIADDNSSGGGKSRVSFGCRAGTAYRIAVDGFFSYSTGGTTLAVTNFVPFLSKTYQAALPRHHFDASGTVTVTTSSRTNALSGVLRLGPKTYRFRGFMDDTGKIALWIPLSRPSSINARPPFVLDLTQMNAGASLAGTVSYKGLDADIVVAQPVTLYPVGKYTRTAPCPRAGVYNFLISITSADLGYGIGRLRVSSFGFCAATGNLGDGTPFGFTSRFLDTGNVNAGRVVGRRLLFGAKGHATADITFNGAVVPPTVSGTVYASRPAKPGSAVLPLGYTTSTAVVGNLFTPPAANTRIIPYFDTYSGHASLYTEAGIYSITQGMILSTNNVFSYDTPNTPKVQLTINKRTGIITGSAIVSPLDRPAKIKGIAIQFGSSSGFYGYAKGINTFGPMYISAVP